MTDDRYGTAKAIELRLRFCEAHGRDPRSIDELEEWLAEQDVGHPPQEPIKRRRGRPRRQRTSLPPRRWATPEEAAAHLGVHVMTLWRGVNDGRITPPSYPSEKSPRFDLDILDADMVRTRAKPSEHEAGRRAAKLAEARRRAREARAGTAGEAEPLPTA
jgi:hypothetical protein